MTQKTLDKIAEWAIKTFIIATIGLIGGIFFLFMLSVIPEKWQFLYVATRLLYLSCVWMFRILTPVFIILSIVTIVGGLIYRITH